MTTAAKCELYIRYDSSIETLDIFLSKVDKFVYQIYHFEYEKGEHKDTYQFDSSLKLSLAMLQRNSERASHSSSPPPPQISLRPSMDQEGYR